MFPVPGAFGSPPSPRVGLGTWIRFDRRDFERPTIPDRTFNATGSVFDNVGSQRLMADMMGTCVFLIFFSYVNISRGLRSARDEYE